MASLMVPQNFWVSIVLYNLTLALIKLTFLFQYYRVLAIHQMKRVIWIGGTIIMLWAVSQLLVVIFTCSPVQKFWETSLVGTCIPNLPFWYINAAGNILTDLAIFVMPLPVLNRLQLRKKQKYFLLGIFSLGFLYVKVILMTCTTQSCSAFSLISLELGYFVLTRSRPTVRVRSRLSAWHTSNKVQTLPLTTSQPHVGQSANCAALSSAHAFQRCDLW